MTYPDAEPVVRQFGERIAYLRDGGLGDLVMMTAGLRACRTHNPTCIHNLYIPADKAPIFLYADCADGIGTEAAFRPNCFEQVCDLRWYTERDPAASIEDRVEVFAKGMGLFREDNPNGVYNGPLEPKLTVHADEQERARAWLSARGIAPDEQKMILLQGHGIYPHRTWRPGFVHDFCEAVKGEFPVVVTALPNGMGQRAQAEAEDAGAHVLMASPYRDLFALISQATLVVTMDSGLYHVAGALKLPFVTYFGEIGWWVRCSHYRSYWAIQCSLPCAPCYELRQLKTEESPVTRTGGWCGHNCTPWFSAEMMVEVVGKRLSQRAPRQKVVIGVPGDEEQSDYILELPDGAKMLGRRRLEDTLAKIAGSYFEVGIPEAFRAEEGWVLPVADGVDVQPSVLLRKVEPPGRPNSCRSLRVDLPPETCLILREEPLPAGMMGRPMIPVSE